MTTEQTRNQMGRMCIRDSPLSVIAVLTKYGHRLSQIGTGSYMVPMINVATRLVLTTTLSQHIIGSCDN